MGRHAHDITHKYFSKLEDISNDTHRDIHDTFSSFVKMTACALSAGQREKEYLEEASKWDKNHLIMFSEALSLLIREMETDPFTDLMGKYYAVVESKIVKQSKGEFYTPNELCSMMANIVLNDTYDGAPIYLNEPTCGAGQMILSSAQNIVDQGQSPYILRVHATDIDYIATQMCYINTTLWGIPCIVHHGDSLKCDVIKSYPNIHWIATELGHQTNHENIKQMITGDE